MDKYQRYEFEKKKLQQECKTFEEYEKKIRVLINKLKI
jgi:hypothetical protein